MKIKLNMKNKLKNTFIFYQREEGEKERKGSKIYQNHTVSLLRTRAHPL
jgi:hypothetical protein